MKHTRLPLLLALAALLSCQQAPFHSEYRELPRQQWDSRDTLTFALPPTDQNIDPQLTINLRATSDYPYRDITTHLTLLCDGHPVSTATIPITIHTWPPTLTPKLQSERTGRLFLHRSSQPHPLHLRANHRYTLLLTHRMRLNPLDHLATVGITLTP